MPAFTLFVMRISEAVQHQFPLVTLVVAALGIAVLLALRTTWGRWTFDHLKLALPIVGPVFRKVAISRFSRTLGTLVSSGVPILQALSIVKETAGTLIVGQVIALFLPLVRIGLYIDGPPEH